MCKCDNCNHVEMCMWYQELGKQGCDFFDSGNGNDKLAKIEEIIKKYDFNDIWKPYSETSMMEFLNEIESSSIKEIKQCIWELYSFVYEIVSIMRCDNGK